MNQHRPICSCGLFTVAVLAPRRRHCACDVRPLARSPAPPACLAARPLACSARMPRRTPARSAAHSARLSQPSAPRPRRLRGRSLDGKRLGLLLIPESAGKQKLHGRHGRRRGRARSRQGRTGGSRARRSTGHRRLPHSEVSGQGGQSGGSVDEPRARDENRGRRKVHNSSLTSGPHTSGGHVSRLEQSEQSMGPDPKGRIDISVGGSHLSGMCNR